MAVTCLDAVARWLGLEWTTDQRESFQRYAHWLVTEGATIGGLGPGERTRVWQRHICDSLTFGYGLAPSGSLLDVGSGLGLPGVPLAIAYPDVEVRLVERAGKRIDALHRIDAILGLGLTIEQADVMRITASVDRATFRASLRLAAAVHVVEALIGPTGEGWFGLGRGSEPDALRRWRSSPPPTPSSLHVEEVCVPAEVLDSEVWLLRMAPL